MTAGIAARHRRAFAACHAAVIGAALLAAPVRADQVVVGPTTYSDAQVIDVQHGRLVFRAGDGHQHEVELADVHRITLSRSGPFTDFNDAERLFADGDAEGAVVRYGRAQRIEEDFWGDLVAARLLMAADRNGDVDRAVQAFIRALRGEHVGPVGVSRLLPDRIPAERDRSVTRSIQKLDTAIAARPGPEHAAMLELLRFKLLDAVRDERADALADRIVRLSFPEAARTREVDTAVLSAFRLLDRQRRLDEFPAELEQAMAACTREAMPDFLLLKGELLLRRAKSRDDCIRASWPFLRVAVHWRSDPRAARGLYGAARVMDRIDRPDKAVELLDECLQTRGLDESLKKEAQALRQRLVPTATPPSTSEEER